MQTTNERTILPGDVFADAYGVFRVMAVADGWAMCRRPRAIPFVRFVRDMQKELARGEGLRRAGDER